MVGAHSWCSCSCCDVRHECKLWRALKGPGSSCDVPCASSGEALEVCSTCSGQTWPFRNVSWDAPRALGLGPGTPKRFCVCLVWSVQLNAKRARAQIHLSCAMRMR
eukprot:8344220-Alexandrium_andersonii.AAC.1